MSPKQELRLLWVCHALVMLITALLVIGTTWWGMKHHNVLGALIWTLILAVFLYAQEKDYVEARCDLEQAIKALL